MARTVRDELLTALEDLGDEGLKKFCAKIRDCEIKEGYRKLTKRKVEKAKPLEVVDVILSYYTASYGPELTVKVLEAIDEKDVALDLKEALEKVKGFTWGKKPNEEPPSTSEVKEGKRKNPNEEPPSTSGASSSSAPEPQVVPFVDKHRKELIARCALVEPILDGLLSKDLLSQQQYDAIRAEKYDQEKMRKLYEFVKGWSPSHKQTLYEILKEENRPLIENLEQQS